MYSEGILNHFQILKYVLLDKNESEINQTYGTENIKNGKCFI